MTLFRGMLASDQLFNANPSGSVVSGPMIEAALKDILRLAAKVRWGTRSAVIRPMC
jgi:hypothetical protein